MSALERGRSFFILFRSIFDNSACLPAQVRSWGCQVRQQDVNEFPGPKPSRQRVGERSLTESLILAQSERWRRG